jgi:hypothetical protein
MEIRKILNCKAADIPGIYSALNFSCIAIIQALEQNNSDEQIVA